MARVGEDYYTIKEASSLLGISLTTMYGYARRAASKGGPPIRRFSRRKILFPKTAFRRWAALED